MSKKFLVCKKIDFCYGHRLLHYEGKCRYLHGHNGRVEIVIAAPELDERGMVVDFGEIKEKVKSWIDEHLDHRMILHQDDPLIPWLEREKEPYVSLPENPSAENIARLIFHKVRELGFQVQSVLLWETPTSLATYEE